MVERNQRKTRVGLVVSNKMDKSVVVQVQRQMSHSAYGRIVRSTKKFTVHDEENQCQIGDLVSIMETKPLSKTKRWRLHEIVSKAK